MRSLLWFVVSNTSTSSCNHTKIACFLMTIIILSLRYRSCFSLLSIQQQYPVKNYSIVSQSLSTTTATALQAGHGRNRPSNCRWKENSPKKHYYRPSSSSSLSTSSTSSTSSSSSLAATKNTMNIENEKVNIGTDSSSSSHILDSIAEKIDNTWIRELRTETSENYQKSLQYIGATTNYDNHVKRPIYNGHYVLVKPTGIPNPKLLLYSEDVAFRMLGMNNEQITSQDAIDWLSGNKVLCETWATPYALSIMGTRYTSNCPFGTGDGYGDGRAISIGEVNGYEIQLKGSGKTPFCRGGDGRAVLRSSVREFLASEAMHHLRIKTTRALSLIVSETETVQRPWYSDGTKLALPDLQNDPRLAQYTVEEKKSLISQLRESNRADPNIMQSEAVAIATRVATSFTRIGHIDLFARRVMKWQQQNDQKSDDEKENIIQSLPFHELEQIIWHACYREYKETTYDPYVGTNDIVAATKGLLQQSALQISQMIANWIRVGFVQGNFNADNCLIGGKTMDYGPFGYVDEYNPVAAKWTGSGQHFGFMNQPSAGLANYQILVESVLPVLIAYRNKDNNKEMINEAKVTNDMLDEFMEPAASMFQNAVEEVFRNKLGFESHDTAGDTIWKELEPLMRSSRTDWTIFFRSLTYIMRDYPIEQNENNDNYRYNKILSKLEGDNETDRDYPGAFYEPLTDKQRIQWIDWITKWRKALSQSMVPEGKEQQHKRTNHDIFDLMKGTNPKYVLREWMLVEAYSSVANNHNNVTELNNLYQLIQHPYEEGTIEEVQKYYRKASDEALVSGGTAFFSCSS